VTIAVARGLSPLRTVLESGAVVTVQEASMTPAVTINATVQAGGVYEPDGQNGIAFLTGRVLDRGTESRSADVIAEELDERGVALRISTARHTTAVSGTCLAEDFDHVLAIVLDTVRRPVFPEAEVAKRRAETINGLRQDQDNPAVRAAGVLLELLYGETHPYARRAKGTIESVSAITRDDLAAYHGVRYRPTLLSLVIVGDVDAGRAVERAAFELEGWTGAAPADPPLPSPPVHAERREAVVAIEGKAQSDIAYGFTSIKRHDPRYYAYWLMNNVLGQFGLGGRLADNIRERQGMAYYAYSAIDPSVGEGPLVIRAGVDPGNVERAVAAIDHEVGAMGTAGVTGDELAQSKQYLIGSIPRMLETNAGIAAFLQTIEQFDLGLDYDRRLPEHLRAVTREDVCAAAAEQLHPERASVAIAGPTPPSSAV
jgi:zinc protease